MKRSFLGRLLPIETSKMTSNHRKGKRYENVIADRLNLKHTGYVGYECPDAENEHMVVDTKFRSELPLWFKEPLEKLTGQAEGRLAAVIWHEKYSRHEDDIVVMRLEDFERLLNNEI